VFLPHELDVMLNGRQNINIQDLKENTVYSDCSVSDQVIVWFWEFAFSLSQEKLGGLLHFVTGNGRVPILGFKYLESNRGEYQKFHIKMVHYDAIDPYPKSHTCFNRLELPLYPSRSIFEKYIEYVTVEMIHFGL
jgi:E3 ubiquitin-protein ligase NEDD4